MDRLNLKKISSTCISFSLPNIFDFFFFLKSILSIFFILFFIVRMEENKNSHVIITFFSFQQVCLLHSYHSILLIKKLFDNIVFSFLKWFDNIDCLIYRLKHRFIRYPWFYRYIFMKIQWCQFMFPYHYVKDQSIEVNYNDIYASFYESKSKRI